MSLRRVRNGEVITGVFSGLGKFFGIDPVVLRLIFVILALCTKGFPAFVIYIVAWLCIPYEEEN